MSIVIDAGLAQHQGERQEQQDRAALFPHPRDAGVLLAVVADGMGGHSGGALAAQQVLHTCGNNLERFSLRGDSPQDLLASSLAEAHLLIKASRFINEKEPHSTAVLLLVQPRRVSWAHCGDSRLYRLRGAQSLFCTSDHSYVERLVSAGRITREQARVHPQRNVLTTSLGGDEAPVIDYGVEQDLRAGDSFVLCSDGLWAALDDSELAAVVAAHTARDACVALIARARSRAQGDGDNVSVLIVKLLAAPGAGRGA